MAENKDLLVMPGYYEIAFCESTARGQQQDTTSQMFCAHIKAWLARYGSCALPYDTAPPVY
jgi:hypothetical protein